MVKTRISQEALRSDTIGEEVVGQLRNHVVGIASMYRKNPFHSFEHASHVTMSVQKMINRIVRQSAENSETSSYTRSIASDSLTKFAVVYAALIQ